MDTIFDAERFSADKTNGKITLSHQQHATSCRTISRHFPEFVEKTPRQLMNTILNSSYPEINLVTSPK